MTVSPFAVAAGHEEVFGGPYRWEIKDDLSTVKAGGVGDYQAVLLADFNPEVLKSL